MSKNKRERESEIISVLSSTDEPREQVATEETGWFGSLQSGWKKKLLYPAAGIALIVLVGIGVIAKNGWLPFTDSVTGKKTGWFGMALPLNASSSWNPLAVPLPNSTPQLSKEYIYAGGRMLAVEDANANAAPPADLAIWRPSSGQWWVMGGTGSQQTTVTLGSGGGSGVASDIPVPGDYDGDGKTDFSVFRPGNGGWYVMKSSTGDATTYSFGFGLSDDLVAPADYDGDGRTDAAVFRPSTGVWYIFRSSDSAVENGYYGINGDKPVPADYDGDGKADLAVWRGGDTTFYVKMSGGGYTTGQFSGGTEQVPGDYDGDGKADMAVRSGANWTILQSSTGQLASPIPWEQAGDLAVHNDYDGDGKVDIAVWRNSTGVWYIRNSRDSSTRTVQWGSSGDTPVPAFYRR